MPQGLKGNSREILQGGSQLPCQAGLGKRDAEGGYLQVDDVQLQQAIIFPLGDVLWTVKNDQLDLMSGPAELRSRDPTPSGWYVCLSRLHVVQVVVNIGRPAAPKDKVMTGKVSGARLRRGDKWESHSRREDSASITSSHRDGVGVLLWRPGARDVGANLATVFAKEGRKEATLQAAVAASQRTEMLSRCHLLLRRALHDLIEGKVGTLDGRRCSKAAIAQIFESW